MGSFWANLFAPQLMKAATYLIRQASPKKANAIIAATTPLLSGVIQAAAGELGAVASQHLGADTVAKVLGVATTEQNIAGVASAVLSGSHTLDVSQTAALSDYLSQHLLGGTAAK